MNTNTSVNNQSTATAREHYTTGSVTSQDGTTIGYRQFGHGPGVVLLHGAASSAHNHMQLAEALYRAFTVYAPDRRGRGLSGPYSEDYSIQKDVEDLDALLALLKQEGVEIDDRREDSEYGRFAWIMDPEGNRIELWEPPKP